MSERLPIPAALLRHRRGPVRIERDANAVVHRLFDLADRGHPLEAAEQAADLLRGPASDLRLVALYLAGTFAQDGVAALPELLGSVRDLLGPPSAAPATEGGGSKAIDSALAWLFRTLSDRLAFHTTQRDAVWSGWIAAATPDEVEQIAAHCDALAAAAIGCSEVLLKLARWARGKLGPAVARAHKAAAEAQAERAAPPEAAPGARGEEPDPSPRARWEEPDLAHESSPAPFDGDGEHLPAGGWQEAGSPPYEDEGSDGHEEDHSDSYEDDDSDGYEEDDDDDDDENAWQAEREPGLPDDGRRPSNARHIPTGWRGPEAQGSVVVIDSPALAQLRDKLRGFEMMLMRGELDKAAVIARDVQTILDGFDPLVYLPSLFARYTQLLHAVYGELEARWQQSEHPSMQVLIQFYRSNLAGFLDESP